MVVDPRLQQLRILHLGKKDKDTFDVPTDFAERRLKDCGACVLPIQLREGFHDQVIAKEFVSEVLGDSNRCTSPGPSNKKRKGKVSQLEVSLP